MVKFYYQYTKIIYITLKDMLRIINKYTILHAHVSTINMCMLALPTCAC